MLKVYVASSWRNKKQPEVVRRLGEFCDVYDFRHPNGEPDGFHWSDIDPEWKSWTPLQFKAALEHPLAKRGFEVDYAALEDCDVCVLVMPCGRSAHLELGYAEGRDIHTAILLDDGEPELMYKMVDEIFVDLDALVDWVRRC